jgi:dTDP-4-dehydrorhamnose 3,5-epimerase
LIKTYTSSLEGPICIEPKVFKDERGFFFENWHDSVYQNVGITDAFVQDNVSYSQRGVLRGLHFQSINSQAKLVSVLKGEVFDVVVDIRPDSPSFGKWEGFFLSSENNKQIYVPHGFAHGFQVLSDDAIFIYKCTHEYSKQDEVSILWNDADLNIDWPIKEPRLSPKDAEGLQLRNISREQLVFRNRAKKMFQC